MTVYILRRTLMLIPLLWAIATVTFFLMHAVPGGPFDQEKPLSESTRAALEKRYDLDGTLVEQYLTFLGNLAQGDLGLSFRQDRDVTEVIQEGLPTTMQLGLCSFVFAVTAGMTLGILSAANQNGPLDYLSVFTATVGASVPNFVLATFFVLFFALQLGWFDVIGWEFGNYRQMVLPVLALGLFPAAFIARITRASMLEVLQQDYIRTARAKGLLEFNVVTRHAIRNAMIPVLTVMGPILAALLTGTFVVEQYFSTAGIGRNYVESVASRDYGMIMGTTLLYAFLIAVMNLLVDIGYAVVNPRIRY